MFREEQVEKRGECGGGFSGGPGDQRWGWGLAGDLWAKLGAHSGVGGSPSSPCVQCFSGDSSAQPIQSGSEGREGREGRSVSCGPQIP